MSQINPILNNPYVEPLLHYATDSDGNLDYEDVVTGRRVFKSDASVMPSKSRGSKEIPFPVSEDAINAHLINLCRKEVSKWRSESYPNTTRITRELLLFWFANPERHAVKKLFFAQQEAVETAIWLNEVAERTNAGQHILNLLRSGQQSTSDFSYDHLPRVAFKMATGIQEVTFID